MNVLSRKTIEPVLIFLSLGTLLTLASGSFGLTWDESIYFKFSDSIRSWFLHHLSFDPVALNVYWDYNRDSNPHPPFMKIWGAIFAHFLGDRLPYPTGYRMGNIVYVSACMALCYRLLASSFSRAAALAAIGFVCFQPRVFGHLIIAATDSPVAVSWLTLTLIVWRLQTDGSACNKTGLRVLMFVVLCCSSATKFTGFMAVLPLALYFMYYSNFRELCWLGGAALCALGFVVLVFPPDWAAPIQGVWHYLFYPFTRSEIPIGTFYLGEMYPFYLPWHYFSVITLVTTPVLLLLLLFGLVYINRVNHHGLLPAILFPAGFWLLIVHLPNTPRHDGIRQFLSFFPFFGLLAWLGLLGLVARLKTWPKFPHRPFTRNIIMIVPAALLLLQTSAWHPFELSFYNRLIGGLPGAEKRGMEVTYYLEAANQDFIRQIKPYLNNGAVVFIHPPWTLLLTSYARNGLLNGQFTQVTHPFDIKKIQPAYLLFIRRRSCIEDHLYDNILPLLEISIQGVSLIKFARMDPLPPSSSGDW